MDYLEQRRKLRQMVQERLDYGRDYTDEVILIIVGIFTP